MNWTYFDEKTPDDGQLIIAANLKGARQFWLWQASHDLETMKILEMDFWCPVPDLPKPPNPPDPFEDYWRKMFVTGTLEDECKKAWDAGREYERKEADWKKAVPPGVKVPALRKVILK